MAIDPVYGARPWTDQRPSATILKRHLELDEAMARTAIAKLVALIEAQDLAV